MNTQPEFGQPLKQPFLRKLHIMHSPTQSVSAMSDQNSAVEHQIRPEELMEELGIKKDAYYAYLKHLGIKSEKDSGGNAWLSQEQANLVRALRSHVKETGKMEGFTNSGGLTIAKGNLLDLPSQPGNQEGDRYGDEQVNDLIRAAANLKGQELVMPELIVRELANRMTVEDMPADIREKVEAVRESVVPKVQPAQVADQVLSQWREQRKQQA